MYKVFADRLLFDLRIEAAARVTAADLRLYDWA